MAVYINPPPQDGNCNCCGKHINDLKPFGHAGDPLVGDFFNALLVKTYRTMALKLEGKELEDYKNRVTENEFGLYDQLSSTIEASWECRDCIILSDKDYFHIQNKTRNNK